MIAWESGTRNLAECLTQLNAPHELLSAVLLGFLPPSLPASSPTSRWFFGFELRLAEPGSGGTTVELVNGKMNGDQMKNE